MEVQKIISSSRRSAGRQDEDGVAASSEPTPTSNHSTTKISEFVSRVCTQVQGEEEEELIEVLLRLAQAKLRRFPGAHPTALTRENLSEAFSSHYFVAIKSDGIRSTLSPIFYYYLFYFLFLFLFYFYFIFIFLIIICSSSRIELTY